jgi:hypothetical protein
MSNKHTAKWSDITVHHLTESVTVHVVGGGVDPPTTYTQEQLGEGVVADDPPDPGYTRVETPFGHMDVCDGGSTLVGYLGEDLGAPSAPELLAAFAADPSIVTGTTFCGLELTPHGVENTIRNHLRDACLRPRFLSTPGVFNPLIAIASAISGVAVEISVPIGHSHLETQTYTPAETSRTIVYEYTTLTGGD